jgi:hypothetical protein
MRGGFGVCWSRSSTIEHTERRRTFGAKPLATCAEFFIGEVIIKDDFSPIRNAIGRPFKKILSGEKKFDARDGICRLTQIFSIKRARSLYRMPKYGTATPCAPIARSRRRETPEE